MTVKSFPEPGGAGEQIAFFDSKPYEREAFSRRLDGSLRVRWFEGRLDASEYFFHDHSDRVITDDLLARLTTFNNVLITSHQAFLTEDALDNIAETTLGNIQRWLSGARGDALPNRVPTPR
jgi:lactate dehydrogenase-like 2-hydroxyacid dehydrogenase